MKILNLLIPVYFAINNSTNRNSWQHHDIQDFREITKFIPDVLPLILEFTTSYWNIDYNKLSNYGCWCSKLANGRERFGGRAVDDFDEICKKWFRLRHCLNLEGGTCLYTRTLESYYVHLPKDTHGITKLSDDVDFHCFPTAQYPNEDQKNCILNICRVDYIHANMLLEKYVEMEIGNNPIKRCETGDRDDNGNGRHNTCEVTDVYPFVKLILVNDSNDSRFKRGINSNNNSHRLAAKFRNGE